MALETLARNALIDRLSWYPPYSMIYIPDEPIEPAFLSRNLTSSMGLLDTLPTELLHIILNLSDFQSLSRFAQVCHQAKTSVELLLPYQQTMKHAFKALVA